jgi:hypothetical protein
VDDDVVAALLQLPRDGEPDDAGTDDGAAHDRTPSMRT